jgi:phosphoglycolate phosphatase-like HAD superfamily hydrolase
MIRLLLFDIDNTLMNSGGAGFKAMGRALEELFGVDDATRGVVPHGKTDPLILREIFHAHELAVGRESAAIRELAELYESELIEEMPIAPARLMPGVREVLDALEGINETVLGLLTGNFEPTARIKLERFGLNRYFQFGAFGSDHEDRIELPPVAVERAEALNDGPIGLGRHVHIIGDTPRDVDCALANGATAVGVATGENTVEELRDSGAHLVFEDFADTETVVEALTAHPTHPVIR